MPIFLCALFLWGTLALAADPPAPPAWRPKCEMPKAVEEPVTRDTLKKFFEATENREKLEKSKDPIDALVCCLPKRMRSQPLLAYKTRSKQKASWDKPRAILSSPTGDPTIAFDSEQPLLEIQDIDPKNKGFRYHELSLGAKAKPHLGLDEDRCDSCHRGRPIWDAYFIWPGFYGSEDDALFRKDDKPATAVEEAKYKEYLESRKTALRYRCLIEPGDSDYETYDDFKSRTYFKDKSNEVRRNAIFGMKMMDLNVDHMATFLEKQPELKPYRALLLGVLICPMFKEKKSGKWGITQYAPPESHEKLSKLVENRYQEIYKLRNKNTDQAIKRLDNGLGTTSLQFRIQGTRGGAAQLHKVSMDFSKTPSFLTVLEDLAGISAEWSFVRYDESYNTTDGNYTTFEEWVGKKLLKKWGPELGLGEDDEAKGICEKIAAKSVTELSLAKFNGDPIGTTATPVPVAPKRQLEIAPAPREIHVQ